MCVFTDNGRDHGCYKRSSYLRKLYVSFSRARSTTTSIGITAKAGKEGFAPPPFNPIVQAHCIGMKQTLKGTLMRSTESLNQRITQQKMDQKVSITSAWGGSVDAR